MRRGFIPLYANVGKDQLYDIAEDPPPLHGNPNVEARFPRLPKQVVRVLWSAQACTVMKIRAVLQAGMPALPGVFSEQTPALQNSYIFAASSLRYATVSLMLSRAVSDAPLSIHNGPL